MASVQEILAKLDNILSWVRILAERPIAPRDILIIQGLSEISDSLGLVKAGEFRAGNGVEPGKGFSGVRITYPAMVYDGVEWHVAGTLNDVLQFGLRATDGAALFGGGIAVLDQEGLKIVNGSGKPVFTVITADTTSINGESLDGGDILIGDNSSGKPNMIWDDSSGALKSRTGIVAAGEIEGGTFKQYGVRVLGNNDATNTVVDSTLTTIEFDHPDTPLYDDAGFFDAGNPDRLTIPTGFGGRYLIGAGGGWSDSWAGNGEMWISIDAVEPYSPLQLIDPSLGGGMLSNAAHSAVHERELNAGEVIRLRVRQDSGSDKIFAYGYIWLHKIQ